MKLFGRKKSAEATPPVASATDQFGYRLVSWAVSGAIIGGLVSGPICLFLELNRKPVITQVATDDAEQIDLRAGEYGLRVVSAWLGATRDSSQELKGLTPLADSVSIDLPTKKTVAKELQVSDVRRDRRVWVVTVSAVVGEKVPSLRYYRVPVAVDRDKIAAVSLPAMVAGPQAAQPPANSYKYRLMNKEIEATVSTFLAAYLCGNGDISRIITPGAGIAPVLPAAFASVKTSGVFAQRDLPSQAPADNESASILVHAVGGTDDVATTMTYFLTIRGRAGQWEVFSVDTAPADEPISNKK